jgi:hypothetical protein
MQVRFTVWPDSRDSLRKVSPHFEEDPIAAVHPSGRPACQLPDGFGDHASTYNITANANTV